jgi:hypothetical protein
MRTKAAIGYSILIAKTIIGKAQAAALESFWRGHFRFWTQSGSRLD